jgi:hypothetical protein
MKTVKPFVLFKQVACGFFKIRRENPFARDFELVDEDKPVSVCTNA